jgi:hypothetical protein
MNPVDYAEQTLGVHTVYEEAQKRLDLHGQLTGQIAALNAAIRADKDNLAARESTLVAEHGAHTAGMSKTAAKEYMKAIIESDPEVERIRDRLAEHESDRAVMDADLRHHAAGLQMLTARMHELGGLLEFYAAAKRTTQVH